MIRELAETLNLPANPNHKRHISPYDMLSTKYMYEDDSRNSDEETKESFSPDKIFKLKSVRSVNDLFEAPGTPNFIALRKGIENDKATVKKIQLALSNMLNVTIKIDGFFGKKVEAMVKIFQESQGLKPDGVVSKGVWDKLLAFPISFQGN